MGREGRGWGSGGDAAAATPAMTSPSTPSVLFPAPPSASPLHGCVPSPAAAVRHPPAVAASPYRHIAGRRPPRRRIRPPLAAACTGRRPPCGWRCGRTGHPWPSWAQRALSARTSSACRPPAPSRCRRRPPSIRRRLPRPPSPRSPLRRDVRAARRVAPPPHRRLARLRGRRHRPPRRRWARAAHRRPVQESLGLPQEAPQGRALQVQGDPGPAATASLGRPPPCAPPPRPLHSPWIHSPGRRHTKGGRGCPVPGRRC
jgi:serine/arginine repetitive matrix protein 1